MSELLYNGVDFVRPLSVLEYRHTPIYNGPDYLYTEYYIRVRAYLNSKLRGLDPVGSEFVIRQKLMQPRKDLFLANGKAAIIDQKGSDAHNGPQPQVFSITKMTGANHTWEVEFAVTTWRNESGNTSALLSNRWTTTHDVDQDFFTTQTVRGRAVFDTALLGVASPDTFRKTILPAIPQNFKRDNIQVSVEDDGSALDWMVIDRQMPLNIVVAQVGAFAANVSRIEATESMSVQSPGWEGAATGIAAIAMGAISAGMANGMAAAMSAASKQSEGMVSGMVPRYFGTIACRVWGNPNSQRAVLRTVALQYCSARASNLLGSVKAAGHTWAINEDTTGKFVEACLSFTCGPIYNFVKGVAGTFSNVPAFSPHEITDPFTADGVGVNPAPVGDGKSRGSYLGAIFAAALNPPAS